ncbi:MAG: hypothetical protein EOP54_01290 [Sphingobacteriales bacterium]|nr:MAG: hypothetical protein EOP54_01290 [Sphingobacteriales bacterium]
MIRILAQGVSLITLLMICSCRNNHTQDRSESHKAGDPASGRKTSVPVAVSAMELCAHFSTDAGMAVSKYKDNILVLSGKVAESAVEPVDHNCRNVIMNCENTDRRDTNSLSIVIKHCIRDEINNDTTSPGKAISIHCRFIAYQDGVIRMEEVAAPE